MRIQLILIALVLTCSKLIAEYMTPTETAAYITDDFNLETIVPEKFADWSSIDTGNIILPPEEGDLSDLIYDQTVTRGYQDSSGNTIMLLIAYGMRQSDQLQVHLPEVCYKANGFDIMSNKIHQTSLDVLSNPTIPIRQIMTRNGRRHEVVSYWTRIGGDIPSDKMQRQLSKLISGLKGQIPDGILVRVSNISAKSEESFILHQKFLNEMMNEIAPQYLKLFIGEN